MHWFSYFKKWIPQEIYYYAFNKIGYRPRPFRSDGTFTKYTSIDDKIDSFFFYTAYIKFGCGRAMSDSSMEVRNGHITKEE